MNDDENKTVGEGKIVQFNPEPEVHLKNGLGVVEKAVPVAYNFGHNFGCKTLVLMVPKTYEFEVVEKLNQIFATGAIVVNP